MRQSVTIRRRGAGASAEPYGWGQDGRFGAAPEKLFCRLPFSAVNIQDDGTVFPDCCPDWVQFPLGNLFEQSWPEVWNGKSARRLRRSMHRGTLRHCDQFWCPHIQATVDGREDWNVRRWAERETLDAPEGAFGGALTMREGPRQVGMHYDDSCNLACPTCRDGIHNVTGPAAERLAALHETVLAEVLPSAQAISLTGNGDPFASPFLRQFLTDFDRRRFPKLERVHLHTNAVLWTPAMWARMSGLHDLEVTTDISIDAATPETYAVVRPPADWDQLMANLGFIATIPSVTSIGISQTVSQVNLDEVEAFYDLGADLAARATGKFFFVEYKRVRRRPHHTDDEWAALRLDDLDGERRARLARQFSALEQRRGAPELRSNLGELLDPALV